MTREMSVDEAMSEAEGCFDDGDDEAAWNMLGAIKEFKSRGVDLGPDIDARFVVLTRKIIHKCFKDAC
jgi:hypothetical protein